MILDLQSINNGYIPQHKIKANFLEYYEEFVRSHRTIGNRHLENSLNALKNFVEKSFLSPIEITESFCESFREYLLKNFNGETPANYFMRFKRVV